LPSFGNFEGKERVTCQKRNVGCRPLKSRGMDKDIVEKQEGRNQQEESPRK